MRRMPLLVTAVACLLAGAAFAQRQDAAQPGQPRKAAGEPAGTKALTWRDVMGFRKIAEPAISEDGRWLAYSLVPDRGDAILEVRDLSATPAPVAHRIERARRPRFSADGAWFAAAVEPGQIDRDKPAKDRPKNGLVLAATSAQSEPVREDAIARFAFSKDSAWLAFLREKPKKGSDEKGKKENGKEAGGATGQEETSEAPAAKGGDEKKKDKASSKRRQGTQLVLRQLATGQQTAIENVAAFAFDPTSRYLAYVVAEKTGAGNGLFCRDLGAEPTATITLHAAAAAHCTHALWQKEAPVLAWLQSTEDDDGLAGPATVMTWDGGADAAEPRTVTDPASAPADHTIPSTNNVRWSDDGQRLFFGYQPTAIAALPRERAAETKADKARKDAERDPFDVDDLLNKRSVDVWHWDDPEIVPHQKKGWSRRKNQTFAAVHHLDRGETIALASDAMPRVITTENGRFALGRFTAPYRQRVTWEGRFFDLIAIDLADGARRPIAADLQSDPSLSPDGGFAVYYRAGHWNLYDCARETTRALTADVDAPFANEDHDYPSRTPGYGVAGWIAGDAAVLIYDKYDVWSFPTAGGPATCLTAGQGRREHRTFRIVQTDPEAKSFAADADLLLTGAHELHKKQGLWRVTLGKPGVEPLLDGDERVQFVAKAKSADRLVVTRERYDTFPDLWTADRNLEKPQRVTDANPQAREFAWGSAELVEWQSLDGAPLQGVLIKPGNYEPGRRYPVLVYFYRFFSQRLHEWNQPVINHRPCFPMYASNGYAIFLPDIRFEVGRPGLSATKCLVPGIQKLIDLGVADKDAIGLHGHSWSGYQAAFVITQTDVFATAVAGAPVSNMTSAYGGIRWGTGLARQFQYEKTQSRIGATLWERRDLYVDNSPVFFADRINTPLLIQFGDADGAVPWYQGIELYLAMRRLGKECVFLQYRGEDHHLAKYPNKLDYAIKMKEWFDHYLKGAAAPKWISNGVPYLGK